MQFIKPIPFQEAIDKIGNKSLIGSTLDSYQWSRVPVALRERSFFSSQVESTRFLQRARDSIGDFLAGTREEITLPDGTKTAALKTGSQADFIKHMQDFAYSEGMGPLDPIHEGTIKDVKTEQRLGLIFDNQTRQAQDYGYWKQGQDPDVLNAFPAQRFIRERAVKEARTFHQYHEGDVRLKTDLDFWRALNRDFGVPWGPWGWGCGHDVEDVDRTEAEQLGLISPSHVLKPAEKDFNEGLQAGTKQLDEDLVEPLKKTFEAHPEVSFRGDTVTWTPRKLPQSAPDAPSVPLLPIIPSAPAFSALPDIDRIVRSLLARGIAPAEAAAAAARFTATPELGPDGRWIIRDQAGNIIDRID